MSHDFEPEPHEKAMIDVMLKGNTTPKWIYDFNKFLIEERTTGEIIKFIDELLHQELQKAREESVKALQITDNAIPPFPSAKDSESARIGFITGVAWARTKLQSELDQPNR